METYKEWFKRAEGAYLIAKKLESPYEKPYLRLFSQKWHPQNLVIQCFHKLYFGHLGAKMTYQSGLNH